VRRRYIAKLGTIPRHPSPQDRIAFWQAANAKLANLANLIPPAAASAAAVGKGRILNSSVSGFPASSSPVALRRRA